MSKNNLINNLIANNYRLFFILLLMIGTSAILFAFFVEFILGFMPCILCIYQRIPYFVLIASSLCGLLIKLNPLLIGYFIILTMVSSSMLAGYHTAIERGLIAPSAKCYNPVTFPPNISAAKIMEILDKQPIASCTKPAFKLLGLSMTEWNLLYSIFWSILCIYLFIIKSKKVQ